MKLSSFTCKQKFVFCAAAMAIVLAYYAFFKAGDTTHNNGIVIGGAFGLSGNCAEWGEGERMAAQMAIDEINAQGGIGGAPLIFVVEDTQCDNKTTVNAVTKLIHVDRARAIIGPTWGDAYQGASSLFNNTQTVGVSPDTAMEALEFQKQAIDYVFSTYAPQRREIASLEEYAASIGLKSIAMIWDQDSYSAMMTRLFRESAPSHGLSITGEHEMPTGNQDFRTVIAKLKAAKPDAVFISFLAAHTKASFLRQAKDLGLTARILSAADIQDDAVLKSFGHFMDGVVYTYPIASENEAAFRAAYAQKYNADPQGPAAVNAYDAVRIVAQALELAPEGGAALRDALLRVRIAGAFIPDLGFDTKHQVAGGEFEIKTVQNGAFVPLK
jgi:branched-chain amino acid transport system substrate-binding protein